MRRVSLRCGDSVATPRWRSGVRFPSRLRLLQPGTRSGVVAPHRRGPATWKCARLKGGFRRRNPLPAPCRVTGRARRTPRAAVMLRCGDSVATPASLGCSVSVAAPAASTGHALGGRGPASEWTRDLEVRTPQGRVSQAESTPCASRGCRSASAPASRSFPRSTDGVVRPRSRAWLNSSVGEDDNALHKRVARPRN